MEQYTVSVENKKLRYRDEHSASIVLSLCTLWHFVGENLLTANQPLLCNLVFSSKKLPIRK